MKLELLTNASVVDDARGRARRGNWRDDNKSSLLISIIQRYFNYNPHKILVPAPIIDLELYIF
ncbi:MAG: hypothetical protein ACJ71F_01450 [Nitrososphaeraceae archaeon]